MTTKKTPKWTKDWEKNIKLLAGKQVDKLYKKDEIKPDGIKVTAENGETIKVNNVEILLTQIEAQKKEVGEKLNQVLIKGGYEEEAGRIFQEMSDLENKLVEWQQSPTNKKCKQAYINAFRNFFGITSSSAPSTGWYRTKGWLKLQEDYISKKVGTDDYSNLYEGTLQLGDIGNTNYELRITEQEYLKLITRTMKEIAKIDKTKFKTYITANPHPLSSDTGHYNSTTLNSTRFTQTNIESWLDQTRNRAKNMTDNLIKGKTIDRNGNLVDHPHQGKPANAKRVEYSFGREFTKEDGTAQDTNPTKQEITNLFDLASVLSYSNWTDHANFKAALATDFKETETLIVLSAETEPVKESKLKEWGITGYKLNNGKTNYYTTNYGNKISGRKDDKGNHLESVEYDWSSQQEVKIEKGITDWARLLTTFACQQYADKKNQKKLESSFDNDPVAQLFEDMRNYSEFEGFGATNAFTYQEFPKYLNSQEFIFYRLQARRDALIDKVKKGSQESVEAEKEYRIAKNLLEDKKKELDNLISDRVKELREELKTKYKVSDNQVPNFGSGTDASDSNRLTRLELIKLRELIKNIRYLVNCDEDKPTDKVNENKTYDLAEEISNKVYQDFAIIINWEHLTKEGTTETCKTDEERIQEIKKNEAKFGMNLTYYRDKFVEYEKLVKLEPYQVEAKKKLDEAINNRDPAENMKDWQNTLKRYDANLETVFDQVKIDKWKEKKDGQEVFDNIAGLESLIKKVVMMKKDAEGKETQEVDKVNEDFINFIKGKDTKLDTLANLFKEKTEPKDIIILIEQWVFNKLDDTKKSEWAKKFAWSDLSPLTDKKVDSYELTDEDKKDGGKFQDFLYQCSIGKINYSSLQKPTEQQENNNPPSEEKGHFGKYWYWYVGGGLIIAVLIGAAIYFWDDISKKFGWTKPEDDEVDE